MFRTRNLLYLALFLFCAFLFLGLPDGLFQQLRSWVNRMAVPVLDVSHKVFGHIDDFFEVLLDLGQVQEENRGLVREVARLRLEVNRLKQVSDENERLTKLLEFVGRSPWTVLAARVVGRSPGHWNQSVWIDRGRRDGLKEGMAVVSVEGVVGKVVEVFPEASRVLLLIDESCKVGALVHQTREMGILQGARSGCVLNYLSRDAQARAGNQVVTSGLSRFFPAGLHIGTVLKVQDDAYGLFQFAQVAPSVNFTKLEEVLVIISQEKTVISETVKQ